MVNIKEAREQIKLLKTAPKPSKKICLLQN